MVQHTKQGGFFFLPSYRSGTDQVKLYKAENTASACVFRVFLFLAVNRRNSRVGITLRCCASKAKRCEYLWISWEVISPKYILETSQDLHSVTLNEFMNCAYASYPARNQIMLIQFFILLVISLRCMPLYQQILSSFNPAFSV